MAQIADPLPAGPTTNGTIAAFEKYIGHQLPTDYQQFLLKYNGGRPEPDAFLLDVGYGEEENIVLCFFPMRDLSVGNVVVGELEGLRTWPLHCAWDALYSDLETLYQTELKNPLLPIGTDGSGNYICIVLSGSEAGTVVFLDHETAESTKLANNFEAFLTSLRRRERTDYAIGSEPKAADKRYDRIGALVQARSCTQCSGSGKCYW